MIHSTIVSTETLAAHLDDPQWVIVDCRFELLDPPWGFESYKQGHIPGAVYASLDNDLAGPVSLETGRHPLPEEREFVARASRWGIEPGRQVVAYDTVSGAFAARLWFLLRLYGHDVVAVLDGGFGKWLAEGRPIRTGIEERPPAKFNVRMQPSMYVTSQEVNSLRLDPRYRIIDARAPIRYRGEQEPIDPVAGHIPGAINRFHGENLSPDGTLLPPEQLRHQFLDLLDGVPPENSIVYCGSGVTSCFHLLAMEYAGLKPGLLYAGSWSEWIRDPSRPVKTGPNP